AEVLVSDKDGNKCYGKSETDAAITFQSDSAKVGDFVRVKIISAKNANLTGEVT
nr:TRAM domain-containing protein [Clostridiales bacterium]